MNEKLNYRSHTVDLELTEIEPQRFQWMSCIDATHVYRSNDVPQPIELARADALAVAYAEIDALEVSATSATRKARTPSHPIASRVPRPPSGQEGAVALDRSEEARRRVARRSF